MASLSRPNVRAAAPLGQSQSRSGQSQSDWRAVSRPNVRAAAAPGQSQSRPGQSQSDQRAVSRPNARELNILEPEAYASISWLERLPRNRSRP